MAKAGQPPYYKTPEEMQAKINEYIKDCEDKEKYLTITGLCYFLGFESRQSFYDYEKREKYSYTVKRARLYIESDYEQNLRKHGRAGDIFGLKNFGWTDKQEIEQTITEYKVNPPPKPEKAYED